MLDVSWNQLEGTLDQFQAAIPSIDSDQPSALWMLNLANNSFTGSPSISRQMSGWGH